MMNVRAMRVLGELRLKEPGKAVPSVFQTESTSQGSH